MQPARKTLAIGVLLGVLGAALVGGAVLARSLLVGRATTFTDGDRIRERVRAAPIRRVLWQPAERVPVAANAGVDEYEPRISADGTTMVVVRGRPGANADLYVRTLTTAGWSQESPIGEINTDADELGPELSRDGRSLYFYSDRAGGLGGFDLWASRRGETSWEPPVNLGSSVNTEFNEYGPALTPDGRELFFASNRPRPDETPAPRNAWTATIREQRGRHDYDLYRVALTEEGAPQSTRTASALLALNTPSDEGAPAVSPVGDFIYFASDRPGGLGGFDVYRSRRLRGSYTPVENVGAAINSPHDDLDPGLSTDGFRLYFSSNRGLSTPTQPIDPGVATPYSLWSSGSREVFSEVDEGRTRRALADLWAVLWPWLVVLILTVLLASLLWWLSRSAAWKARYRRLSLLARCVLVSLAVHALLASVFAVWRVGTGVGEFLRRSGGTRVVLASAGTASALTSQVRGLPRPIAARPDMPAFTERMAIAAPSIDAPHLDIQTPPRLQVRDSAVSRDENNPERPTSRDDPSEPAMSSAAVPLTATSPGSVALPKESLPAEAVVESVRTTDFSIDAPRTARASLATPPPGSTPQADFSPAPAAFLVPDRASPTAEISIEPAPTDTTQTIASGLNSPPPVAPPPLGSRSPSSLALPREVEATSAAAPESTIPLTAAIDLPSIARAALSVPSEAAGAPMSPVNFAPPAAGSFARDNRPSIDREPAGDMISPTETLSPIPDRPTSPSAVALPSLIAGPGAIDRTSPRLPVVEPEAPPIEAFAQRDPDVREQVLRQMGGNEETERAVRLALDWFRSHQSADGRWSGRNFDDRCGACAGPAEIDADAAMTGMVLLCYLGAGHTHTGDGPYRPQVRRAIDWLVARQAPNGDLRAGETMYSHTVATVALCEAFAMTRDGTLEAPTKRAAAFLFQGAAKGGGRRDGTSVLGWEVMAMESARRAGIQTPRTTFESARRFLDSVAVPGEPGKYAYRRGDAPSAAMTAEAMFVRQLLGHSREEPIMEQSAAFILDTPPRWKDGAPTYYWYYATLALFQQQGEPWERWNTALAPELLKNQRADGPATGSWDPQDQWSKLGGRVYQTAVCTLSLEVYYRYRAQGLETPALSGPPAR